MNLNNIILSDNLVVELYKNNLIEDQNLTTSVLIQPATQKKTIQYLGNNQKKICLLVNYENEVYLPDEQLKFLTAILQACKLNLGDVAIVNHFFQKISFEAIKQQLDCNYLLIFGIDTKQLGLKKIEVFSPEKINNCEIIVSLVAEQLNNSEPQSKILKSKLWNCLKQMFNV